MAISQAVLFIGAAILLTCVPVAGKYFRVLNTLLHEIGHVLASLFFGGGIHQVRLFWDTSGVAYTSSANKVAVIVTSLCGYPFASVVAYLVAWASLNDYTEWLYYALFMILAISLVFWVRNWFGFFWLVAFFAGTAAVYMYASGTIQQTYMHVITAVLLVESIRSSWVIFYLSLVSPQKAGDATVLKRSTGLSSRFWGLFFLVQALYFGIYLPGKLLAG